jgi:3'-5' exoribonuclease
LEELPPLGETVRQKFLLRDLSSQLSRRGQIYLTLQLACPAGAVSAVVFDHASVLKDILKKGQLLEADLSHGERGYQLSEINPLSGEDFDAWDYLPKSPFDEEEMWQKTEEILSERVQSEGFKELLSVLLKDEEFVKQYRLAPAALSVHHPYRSGLMEHVLNGLELLPAFCERYEASLELCTLGFWLHDIGKLWEIDFFSGKYSPDGELIGHLSMGASFISEKLNAIETIEDSERRGLLHILISHHGSLEKGSPRAPMSKEAVLVHCLDQLDSEMFQMQRDLKNIPQDGFSARNSLMGKKFYQAGSSIIKD